MPTSYTNFIQNGTVTVNAQPNITSVGNLSNLNVIGISNLNAVSNVIITGGSNGQAIITNGNGTLSFGNVGTGNGTVTQVDTSGNGLGFTLTGGPITTTGTITLTVPNATSLRSSLTIGNVANLNLNGNGSTYLAGNGVFIVPAGTYSNANVANYLPTYTGNVGSSTSNINYLWANYVSARFDVSANTVSAPNITSTLLLTGVTGNFTGNLNSNNLNVTNLITGATGNITTINGTTGNFSGNITSNNANLGNLASANFFSGNGYLLTGITANYANFAGNVVNAAQPNITSVGTLTSLTVSGNINGANIIGNHYGNGAALSSITGANVTGTVANATYATSAGTAGTVTTANQPNITSVGTLTSLNVNGQLTATYGLFTGSSTQLSQQIINASELVTIASTGLSGTVNYDVNTQSVVYNNTNPTNNWTFNFRGSSGTSLNNTLSTGNSVTCSYIINVGNTGYYANSYTVDGSSVTPIWQGINAPTSGTMNSYDVYTFCIIKTASSTYKILASKVPFA